jgi:nucleoside-diphosphate-sugar epimerase
MANVFRKVLLTGGAGFIGSHLLENLLQDEQLESVVVVDNLSTGQKRNIESFLEDQRLTFIEHDLTDLPWLENFLQQHEQDPFSLILHFASPASPPRYQAQPVMTYQVNAFTTHFLAKYASQFDARLLFASTSEVYGDPAVSPQPESYWGNVNPNGLRSCYDEAKRLGETICGVWHRQTGADIRLVRIFNTYGPRMDITDGRVIPSFFDSILRHEPITVYGTGEQTRSFCFVTDLVRGLLTYARKDGLDGETINLGNPDEYSMLQLVEQFEKLLGQSLDREFSSLPADDPLQRRPDNRKAQTLLDWQPQVSLKDGLQATYAYFQSHQQ